MLPILLRTEHITLYSYPFMLGIAWGVAYGRWINDFQSILGTLKTKLIFFAIFLSSWVGAKILFLLTAKGVPGNLGTETNFWLGGGFVFLGGLIGAVGIVLLTKIFYSFPTMANLNKIIPTLCLAHGIGRLGCFLAGCCFGKESHGPLALEFNGVERTPIQLIEALFLFTLFFLFTKRNLKWDILSLYLVGYGLFRFIIEFFRADDIRGYWLWATPSQWIGGIMVLSGFIFITLKNQRLK